LEKYSLLANVLVSVRRKRLIYFHTLVAEHLAVGSKNGGIKYDIQLLVSTAYILG